MSRSKPYSRQSSSGSAGGKRDTDSAWKHDLHDTRPALLQRLRSGSSSPAGSPSASSLKARLGLESSSPRDRNSPSYAGRELLPGNSRASGLRSDGISNAGKELLPAGGSGGKNARSGRGSRPRGSNGNEGAAFAANTLGNLRRDRSDRNERGDRGDRRDKPVSIAGAARAWVRVEHLAPGTTGADVKSAFASSPIQRAEVTSRPGDRDVVVELELPDEDAARDLVRQYDGVSADGQRLRVSVISRSPAPQQKDLSSRLGGGRKEESGKMYSDQIQMLQPRPPQKTSLADRIGRR